MILKLQIICFQKPDTPCTYTDKCFQFTLPDDTVHTFIVPYDVV